MRFIRAMVSGVYSYYNVDRVHKFYAVEAFTNDWHVNAQFVDNTAATLLTGFTSESAAQSVLAEIVTSIGIVDPASFQ